MEKSEFYNEHIWTFPLENRVVDVFVDSAYPSRIQGFCRQGKHKEMNLHNEGTHFGFVHSGNMFLTRQGSRPTRTLIAQPGMYFCLPGAGKLEYPGDAGACMIITRLRYKGMFLLGGPIEECGRLKYIDGCTASLLLAPVRYGDACLNYLHFPAHTTQAEHTHPTLRVGLVIRGEGICSVPDTTGRAAVPLTIGTLFVIPPGKSHYFVTQDQAMEVVTYHPDSDFGPHDQNHPVINRTAVDGVSATHLIR